MNVSPNTFYEYVYSQLDYKEIKPDEYLKTILAKLKLPLFVVTLSPQKHLVQILNRLKIKRYITKSYTGDKARSADKKYIYLSILNEYRLNYNDVTVVGDNYEDEALNQILEKSGRSGNPQPKSPTEERVETQQIQPAQMMPTNTQQTYNPLADNQQPQPTPEVSPQPQVSSLEPQQTVSQNTPPQTVAPVTGVYPPIGSMTLQQIGNLINKEYRLGNNPYSSGVKLADSVAKTPRAQDNQISSPQITMDTSNTGR